MSKTKNELSRMKNILVESDKIKDELYYNKKQKRKKVKSSP